MKPWGTIINNPSCRYVPLFRGAAVTKFVFGRLFAQTQGSYVSKLGTSDLANYRVTVSVLWCKVQCSYQTME